MGGRDAEMTFGLGEVEYQEMYVHTSYDAWQTENNITDHADITEAGSLATRVVMKGSDYEVITATTTDAECVFSGAANDDATDAIAETFTAAVSAIANDADNGGVAASTLVVKKQLNQLRYSAGEGMLTLDGDNNPQTNLLTTVIQNVQAKINTARVQAGSQYAALESAVNYTTDLTAQYELGYNTVNDVNFSMETAHMAKNQILQQAATAMLAQANQGQQGLLQLIQ